MCVYNPILLNIGKNVIFAASKTSNWCYISFGVRLLTYSKVKVETESREWRSGRNFTMTFCPLKQRYMYARPKRCQFTENTFRVPLLTWMYLVMNPLIKFLISVSGKSAQNQEIIMIVAKSKKITEKSQVKRLVTLDLVHRRIRGNKVIL